MTTTICGLDGLRSQEGKSLGMSSWYAVTQPDLDEFAAVTGDNYWIHVDAQRAAGSEFGTTIAHGLFTLSLGPRFSYEIYEITDVSLVLNYGFDRVRFIAPLPCGSAVRMHATLAHIDEAAGGLTVRIEQTFERKGHDKPVCVAESLIRVMA